MKPEVRDRLITGHGQLLSAQASGASRFAIADAYLAMDNYFSAALLDVGVDPTFNHQVKLKRFFGTFSTLMQGLDADESVITRLYENWQKSRYSVFVASAGEVVQTLRLVRTVMSAIRNEIATRHGIDPEVLEDEIYSQVLGSRWNSFDEEVGEIHEHWQMHAEHMGEMGVGTKLGNKALNPSNFSDVTAFADDETTKRIISENHELGREVAKFYDQFLKLVVHIQNERMDLGIAANEVTNFLLSITLRYHGQTMEEIGDDWGQRIVRAIQRLNLKPPVSNSDPENAAE